MHSYGAKNYEYKSAIFNISDVNSEFPKDSGKLLSNYPQNLTIINFTKYMWKPVLM